VYTDSNFQTDCALWPRVCCRAGRAKGNCQQTGIVGSGAYNSHVRRRRITRCHGVATGRHDNHHPDIDIYSKLKCCESGSRRSFRAWQTEMRTFSTEN